MDIKELIYLEVQNYKAVLNVYKNIEKFDTLTCLSFCFHSGFYDNRINYLLSYV